MKTLFLGALALSLLALDGGPDGNLIVHEWGTFTSVAGADGAPLIWNPFSGPTDLPRFVYRPDEQLGYLNKAAHNTTIRMETPVLYFYSGRDMDVNVKVDFPRGAITEWYPQAQLTGRGIDWGRVRVRPGAPDEFPREQLESHYYPARETDAAPIQVTTPGIAQDEKFLFYRGVGTFPLPVRVTLANDRVTVKNQGKDPVQAILFENRNGRTGFRILGAIRDSIGAERPELSTPASEAMAELERMLIKSGLYEKEARAMLKTWRDSWFEEGLRVFYLVPRAAADAILPLTLAPAPQELARVFVGRAEVLTPEMEQRMREILKRVGDDQAAFWKEVQPFGRFAQPLLRRVASTFREEELTPSIRRLLQSY
ncbi:MAG TPA: hypothetical protein VNM14_09085 [Planctomycetota bacterium]|nr:hypothetical protein [Planctomycetota bacterium]